MTQSFEITDVFGLLRPDGSEVSVKFSQRFSHLFDRKSEKKQLVREKEEKNDSQKPKLLNIG
jgi:hypothetical protein